jgi:benzoyl-CoA reductase/2-hydroxyglutaryl-CoA dehydratase subunit BcrC/BadD/HgdB
VEPLINDGYAGQPRSRVLNELVSLVDVGKPVVGVYCCFAPLELIWAAGAGVADLCAFSEKTIPEAELVLPSNICPLVKSSYGFIVTNSCPFFALSSAVVAETTCDGKKKMYELITKHKPMTVLDLPQIPDEEEALIHWESQLRKMRLFLETRFSCEITDDGLESAIQDANHRRRLLMQIISFARFSPPHVRWSEVREVIPYGLTCSGEKVIAFLEKTIEKLEARRAQGIVVAPADAPRVLVTGCPIGGDAEKVFHVIEEAGGVVVCHESCSGVKPLLNPIEEGTDNPLAAIARRYLQLPCSCMTPNTGRIKMIDQLIDEYKPDAVIDVTLLGCITYSIESHIIRQHISQQHAIRFLKIETDYSSNDIPQLRTRIEALLETVG